MTPSEDLDAAIELAADEALGTIRQMMQRPVRLAPFAIVMGVKGIVTMPVLDLSARVEALRYAVSEVEGQAFVMFYDGLLSPRATFDHREALFRLQMTHTGHGRAIAYPYTRAAGVLAFGPPEEHDESLAWLHAAVFRPELNSESV